MRCWKMKTRGKQDNTGRPPNALNPRAGKRRLCTSERAIQCNGERGDRKNGPGWLAERKPNQGKTRAACSEVLCRLGLAR